jgi:hypothetical protein
MRKFWKRGRSVEESRDTVTHPRKLDEALRKMQEPLAFTGEDVEAARKVEEQRDTAVSNKGRAAMRRDKAVHRAAMRHKAKGFHSIRRQEKRKGNFRNNVEDNTINRIK